MPRPALRVEVSHKDQQALKKLLRGGIEQVRVVLRAVALQRLAEGMGAPQIAAIVPLTRQSIRNLARRYEEGGLDRALYEKPRPGAQTLLTTQQRQRIIAMVCSDPPQGRARWTMRLAAEEAVKRRLVPRHIEDDVFLQTFLLGNHNWPGHAGFGHDVVVAFLTIEGPALGLADVS